MIGGASRRDKRGDASARRTPSSRAGFARIPGGPFVFNLVLRLKGWLANQAIRYLVQLFLGRYAVRALWFGRFSERDPRRGRPTAPRW